jgi:hypothetical protein
MMMIGPVDPEQKGWVGTQHEWRLILENQKPNVQDISAAFHNNETEISVREWVLTQEPHTYGDKISKLLQINQCAGRLE